MTSSSKSKSSSRNYAGMSEAERVQERRQRFIAAGVDVFGTLGLRKATVRTLCKAARLTERYFYESFDDIESLFCAVYANQAEDLRNVFIAALPTFAGDLAERIHLSLELFFKLMMDERKARVLLLEALAGSPRVSRVYHENIRLYAELAAQFIRIDNPNIDKEHEVLVALGLGINGACSSLALEWMLEGYKLPLETVVKSASLIVLGTMRELLGNSGTV